MVTAGPAVRDMMWCPLPRLTVRTECGRRNVVRIHTK